MILADLAMKGGDIRARDCPGFVRFPAWQDMLIDAPPVSGTTLLGITVPIHISSTQICHCFALTFVFALCQWIRPLSLDFSQFRSCLATGLVESQHAIGTNGEQAFTPSNAVGQHECLSPTRIDSNTETRWLIIPNHESLSTVVTRFKCRICKGIDQSLR